MTEASITREEAHKIATDAAAQAIRQVLREMGIDVGDFKAIESFRDDLRWVSKYRKHSESVGSKMIVTMTMIATGGIIATLWQYLKERT